MPIVKQCKNGQDTCGSNQSNIDYYTVAEATPDNTYVFYCETDWNDCQYEKVSTLITDQSQSNTGQYEPLPGVSMVDFTLAIVIAWGVGRIGQLMRQMTLRGGN